MGPAASLPETLYRRRSGVKDKDGKIHAIEARIFPKATPDGGRQFAWDLMPDSVMTNATVGTVIKAAQGAVRHVTFTGGESEYSIGPDVPILANAPGDMSLLKPGAAVFVIALKNTTGSTARHSARGTGSLQDSPLEGGVSCELVSESQPKPLAAFIFFYFATLKRAVQPAPVHRPRRKSL